MIVRRIGVLSLAKIMGALYTGIGLVIGAFVALLSLFGAALGAGESPEAWMGTFFGIGAIVFLPIFYGLLGFVGGLIGAALYNLVAGFIGGLELDVVP